jgi:tetratricopeptide (TPR) repeat protein
LVAKSLVRVKEQSGEARYHFLEPVRQYALLALQEAGELTLLQDRHLGWCVRLAERAEPALVGGLEQQVWLERLEAEHDNCRAALRWALEQPCPEQGLRLSAALWRFWNVRGYDREGGEWLEALLRADADGTASAAAVRAKALYVAATTAHALGSYERATERADAARLLYRQLDDQWGVARAHIVLGMIATHKGDFDSAERLFAEALRLGKAAGMTSRLAPILMNLGVVASTRGHSGRAMQYYEEAADLFRSLGDMVYVARALSNMGELAIRLDDAPRAVTLYEESLAYARRYGSVLDTANALGGLADVARRTGQHARAVALARDSVVLLLQYDDHRELTLKLAGLAQSLAGIGQFEPAACVAGAVVARCETLGIRMPEYEWAAFQQAIRTIEDALGEARSRAIVARGRYLTAEQLVAMTPGPETPPEAAR